MSGIKIMTFNILAENCVDFKNPAEYYPYIEPRKLRIKNRLPGIIDKIKKEDCDIVLLQEVTYSVREILVEKLPNYLCSRLAVNNPHEPKNMHWCNATLLKRGVFTKISHVIQNLHPKSYTAYSTIVCKHIATQKQFMIMNVHLESENYLLRREEANYMYKFLKKYLKKFVIVVSGDFNSADQYIHNKFDKYFTSAVPRNKASSTYLCIDEMIDYIYVHGIKVIEGYIDNKAYCGPKGCSVRKNIPDQTPECMRKTIDLNGSDHYPIILKGIIKD
jgi:endonuclease/exonuclease/phosphatase family metal-dependent hydrolase